MIRFEEKYFKPLSFSKIQIEKYLDSAYRNLKIAGETEVPEVKFQFGYNAFIRLGITLIASYGYKVSSRAGHHVKIIKKISEILNSEKIFKIGDRMRERRNKDMYGESLIISRKESEEYFIFVKETFGLSKIFFTDKLGKLIY